MTAPRLHPSDIRAIARAVAAELRSERASGPGGRSGGEEPPCDGDTMDLTNTEANGESQSLQRAEERGRLSMRRFLREQKQSAVSARRTTRAKGSQ